MKHQTHLGSLQRSFACGAYSASLTPWLHLRGPTSKTGEGEGVNEVEKGVEKSLGPPIFTTDRRPLQPRTIVADPCTFPYIRQYKNSKYACKCKKNLLV